MHFKQYRITDGDLVYFKYGINAGNTGIVVDHNYRRDHSYLDNELWLLVLFNDSTVWQRAEEVAIVTTDVTIQ